MEFWKTEIAAAADAPPFWRRPHPSSKERNGASGTMEQVMFRLHFLQDQPSIF